MSNRQVQLDATDWVKDLEYHPLEPRYMRVQYLRMLLIYLFLMGLSASLFWADGLTSNVTVALCLEILLLVAMCFNLRLVPQAYRIKGYALREHDITYRSGLFFPTVTTIPYSKIQQAGIRQTLLSRIFGLYSVRLVNGAQQLDSLTIPGLQQAQAHGIKEQVIASQRHEDN